VFQVTSGGNSTSGTLEAGTYTFMTFIDARASAAFNAADPAASSSQSQVTATANLTIGSAPGACPSDATPSVQIGQALAEGCFTERKDSQGNPTGVFETDQKAWVGGFDLKPDSGGKLVIEPGNRSSPIRAEGNSVEWVLSPSLSVPAPLGELKPFTSSTRWVSTPRDRSNGCSHCP
jgi:hypothetical protein